MVEFKYRSTFVDIKDAIEYSYGDVANIALGIDGNIYFDDLTIDEEDGYIYDAHEVCISAEEAVNLVKNFQDDMLHYAEKETFELPF